MLYPRTPRSPELVGDARDLFRWLWLGQIGMLNVGRDSSNVSLHAAVLALILVASRDSTIDIHHSLLFT